ncbi:MAG: cell division protein PerM [Nocardioides sp.]
MTSLIAAPRQRRSGPHDASTTLRRRQPVWAVGLGTGLLAAASTLVAAFGFGVVGWFLSDAGTHGSPRDALRTGGLGWLMGHGSGVTVQGTAVTAVPLGITVICAWAIWRMALRAGTAVSGHGPTADSLADGARDLVVPLTTTLFTLGYLVVVDLALRVTDAGIAGASAQRAMTWSILGCLLVGGAGIAAGSGRAATWAHRLPGTARGALACTRRIIVWWLAVSLVAVTVSLIVDFSTAANVMSQLHTDPSATVLYLALMVLIVPNAMLFSSAFLLGPGFVVGTGTLVTPTVVSTGALPMVPLLAALPAGAPSWGGAAWLLAPAVGAAAVVSTQRRMPTLDWLSAALRGGVGGVLAAIVLGVVTSMAGGAVGPGAMAEVHPFAGATTLQAIVSFGVAGTVAGLAVTWWQRRSPELADLAS